MGGFRFTHRMVDGKSVKLRYILDVIPVAVLNYPRELPFQNASGAIETVRDRKTVYDSASRRAACRLISEIVKDISLSSAAVSD
jgi:hypothetical protein